MLSKQQNASALLILEKAPNTSMDTPLDYKIPPPPALWLKFEISTYP